MNAIMLHLMITLLVLSPSLSSPSPPSPFFPSNSSLLNSFSFFRDHAPSPPSSQVLTTCLQCTSCDDDEKYDISCKLGNKNVTRKKCDEYHNNGCYAKVMVDQSGGQMVKLYSRGCCTTNMPDFYPCVNAHNSEEKMDKSEAYSIDIYSCPTAECNTMYLSGALALAPSLLYFIFPLVSLFSVKETG